MARFLSILIAVTLSLGATSCFQILNYLQFNPDGSMDVLWRFTIPKAMTEASSQNAEEQDMGQKLEEARQQIQKELKGSVEDLKVMQIDTEYDSGLAISFHVPDKNKMPRFQELPGKDKLPAFPVYDPATHSLKVTFEQEEAAPSEEPANSDPSVPPSPDAESSGDENADSGDMEETGEKLAQMILSSARYQIIISGAEPSRARSMGSETRELEIVPLGKNYLIDYPFMSAIVSERQDVDLVIELKK
ncbi:MAG: hypothetical protein KDK25_09575 [Leptospiraceae bacterium]|nr:hypothetical protein [Leptospiraceae bacterium]